MPRYPYSFDRVAAVYDRTRAIPVEAVERIVASLQELVGRGRLLEVGVGSGRLSVPLQRSRVFVVGTDVSRGMLGIAQQKGLKMPVLADAYHLPFGNGTFYAAMTNRVLHLLEDWRRALREVGRTTQRWYLSVLEHESARPDLDAEYSREVEGEGRSTRRPGIYERDLARELRPDRRVTIGRFQGSEPAAHTVAMLENRVFSSQWSIPEEAHREAIAALYDRYHGSLVRTENMIEIAIWDVDRLLRFVAADAPEVGSRRP